MALKQSAIDQINRHEEIPVEIDGVCVKLIFSDGSRAVAQLDGARVAVTGDGKTYVGIFEADPGGDRGFVVLR